MTPPTPDATREAEIRKLRAEIDRLGSVLDIHSRMMHPWYGPCDGFGPGDQCTECVRVLDEARTEAEHWKQTYKSSVATRQVLGDKCKTLEDELARLRAAPDASDHDRVDAALTPLVVVRGDRIIDADLYDVRRALVLTLAAVRTTSYRDGYQAGALSMPLSPLEEELIAQGYDAALKMLREPTLDLLMTIWGEHSIHDGPMKLALRTTANYLDTNRTSALEDVT